MHASSATPRMAATLLNPEAFDQRLEPSRQSGHSGQSHRGIPSVRGNGECGVHAVGMAWTPPPRDTGIVVPSSRRPRLELLAGRPRAIHYPHSLLRVARR
eukprot:scaffold102236_cov67-Phaeocystis_antarctica.AAC.4